MFSTLVYLLEVVFLVQTIAMLQDMLAKVTTGNEPGSPTLQPVESWKSITDVDVWWIKNKRKTACDSTEGWYGAMLLI